MENMKRSILPFDKEKISKDEILEHVKWYQDHVEEGYVLLRNEQKFEAREKLREINKQLEQEYHYYQLERVNKLNLNNILFKVYFRAIHQALAHQNQKNSYSRVHSNLYDIADYLDEIHFTDL